MKFQRAAESMRVPPDLTTATLYKYMALCLLFPLHSWHCYLRWNRKCARGIGGKRLFEENGRVTRWIVSDFVRAMNEANRVKLARVSGWATSGVQVIHWYQCLLKGRLPRQTSLGQLLSYQVTSGVQVGHWYQCPLKGRLLRQTLLGQLLSYQVTSGVQVGHWYQWPLEGRLPRQS
jgi:hypothetical protein